MRNSYKLGDPVVFSVTKFSTDPGPCADDIHPVPYGETYHYQVDKFWLVGEILEDGQLLLLTRRGKRHTVAPDDPRLRPARWWERWLHRNRFPNLDQALAAQPDAAESPAASHSA